MMGVGGRVKPWAPMLNAALEDDILGGVARSQGDRLDALAIHPLVARRLVMGGPEVPLPFGNPPSLKSEVATQLGAGDAADYLNCTAQDISWLRARGSAEHSHAASGGIVPPKRCGGFERYLYHNSGDRGSIGAQAKGSVGRL